MSIVRMYFTPDGAKRPTHYREAWWESEASEFILHHGDVGEAGTTNVEALQDSEEAETLLASFVAQNTQDGYVGADEVPQETFRITIRYKGSTPTQVESTNAEKFVAEYTGMLAWRGLGVVETWEARDDSAAFVFDVVTVHHSKATKLVAEALKKTDFRRDRMSIERS